MNAQAYDLHRSGASAGLTAIVATDGSAAHPHFARLANGGAAAAASLADAAHLLCLLHGRYPGVLDAAAERVPHPGVRDWMDAARGAFAVERSFVTRLAVAAGPLPSTPRQSQSQSAVIAQGHALNVLARSERRGTALGAALAVALDWAAIRIVLDAAARRFDLEPPAMRLPDPREGAAVAAVAAEAAGIGRALDFGVRQVLVQHRGLWDLLESREAARG